MATSALTGYHLKLWITEKSQGMTFYRGVQKCEVTTTEDEGPDAKKLRSHFWENITLINADRGVSTARVSKVLTAAATALVGAWIGFMH